MAAQSPIARTHPWKVEEGLVGEPLPGMSHALRSPHQGKFVYFLCSIPIYICYFYSILNFRYRIIIKFAMNTPPVNISFPFYPLCFRLSFSSSSLIILSILCSLSFSSTSVPAHSLLSKPSSLSCLLCQYSFPFRKSSALIHLSIWFFSCSLSFNMTSVPSPVVYRLLTYFNLLPFDVCSHLTCLSSDLVLPADQVIPPILP